MDMKMLSRILSALLLFAAFSFAETTVDTTQAVVDTASAKPADSSTTVDTKQVAVDTASASLRDRCCNDGFYLEGFRKPPGTQEEARRLD